MSRVVYMSLKKKNSRNHLQKSVSVAFHFSIYFLDPYIDSTVNTSQLITSVQSPMMTLASCQPRHVQWLLVLPLVQGFKLFPSQCVNASGCNTTEAIPPMEGAKGLEHEVLYDKKISWNG